MDNEEFIGPMSEEEFREAYENGHILNLETYFDEDLNYIEEFDTYNGHHHIMMVKLEDWNEKIRQFADEILAEDVD